jgi:hypothetical protein
MTKTTCKAERINGVCVVHPDGCPRFSPDDRVQLTAAFLRSTGQHTGPEPFKVWTVTACDCGLCVTGRFIATDEQAAADDHHLPGAMRHINVANLEAVGEFELS